MARDKHLDLPEELEALLRKALSIEPSPEFLPRVREQVGAPPRSAFWSWRLWFSGAAAAAVCVVALNMPIGRPSAPPAASQVPARGVAQSSATPLAPERADPAPSPVPTRVPSRAPRSPTAVAVAPAGDLPVVVVDEGQRSALNAVMQMVSDGRLTDASFARTTQPSMQPIREQVAPIGVKPVELRPIAVGGVLRQSGK